MVHRERLLHLSLSLVGQKVVVTQKDGGVFEGIFHTFTPFPSLSNDMKNRYVFNTVKVVKSPPASEDKAASVTIEDGSTVVISAEKVVYVHAKNVSLDRPPAANGGPTYTPPGKAPNDVMTDTQISGRRGGRDRDLVAAGSAWTTGGGGSGGNSRAEALASASGPKSGGGSGSELRGKGLKGSIGGWDQFRANEELFNVNASYDENMYTTELDKSQIDSRKIAEAERIAREIENTTSANIHIAEERGHVVETDFDEEDRYSGVLTKEGKNRHEATSKDDTEPLEPVLETSAEKSSSSAPKMNYAAAAAKADTAKTTGPPGFSGKTSPAAPSSPEATSSSERVAKVTPDAKNADEAETKPTKSTEEADSESKGINKPSKSELDAKEPEKPSNTADSTSGPVPPKESADKDKAIDDKGDKSYGAEASKETKPEKEKKSDTKEVKKNSKLNANAKSFSFNPNAKTFTPSFGGSSSTDTQAPQQQQQMPDMHAPIQMHGGHPMQQQQQPHYMHAPMGQPGKFFVVVLQPTPNDIDILMFYGFTSGFRQE